MELDSCEFNKFISNYHFFVMRHFQKKKKGNNINIILLIAIRGPWAVLRWAGPLESVPLFPARQRPCL